jgi:hypothetical protein
MPSSRSAKNLSQMELAWRQSDNIVNPFLSAEEDAAALNIFRADPKPFIEQYAKINTKEGKIADFKLNRGQTIVHAIVQKYRRQKKPVRLIILKARQVGISTYLEALIFWRMRFWKHTDARIVSFENGSATKIFNMTELYYESLPENLRPPKYRRTKGMLIMGNPDEQTRLYHPGLMSGVEIGTAKNVHIGRGSHYQCVHLCLTPSTPVIVGDGVVKAAKDVVPGDRILTHNGAHTTVKTVFPQTTEAKIMRIRPWLGRPMEVTDNHPIWTKRGWVEAKDLTKDDWVSMPRRKFTTSAPPRLTVEGRGSPNNHNRQHESGVLPYTEDVGFAIGYYLADGSILYGPPSLGRMPRAVCYSDDYVETYIDRAWEALKPFSTSIAHRRSKTSRTVAHTIYSAGVAEMLEREFGAKDSKRIPDWVFDAGEDFCKGLALGYLAGDGSFPVSSETCPSVVARSIRSSLVMQVRDIIAALGWGWGSNSYRPAGAYYGRNCQECWSVSFNGDTARRILRELNYFIIGSKVGSRSVKYEITEDKIWMKVRSIETSIHLPEVWNIEVEHADHSYRTESFSVKNTEVALWKDAYSTTRSILQCIPSEPETYGFIESTSNGADGYFYDEFMRARERLDEGTDTPEWYPIFLPFWLDKGYEHGLTLEEEMRIAESADEYEKAFKNDYKNVTWGHISWRRQTLSEKCQGNKATFDLEYAPTVDEAFAASGQTVFNKASLLWYRENTVKNGRVGKLIVPDSGMVRRPYFVEDPDGPLTIWEFPREGMGYGIGCDAALGKAAEEGLTDVELAQAVADADSDYCAGVVLSKEMHQVAEYKSRVIAAFDFADEMVNLGHFYNTALIMPEVGNQGAGYAIQKRFKEVQYPSIGRWEKIDDPKSGKLASALGWEINYKTKAILIGEMQREIMRGAGHLDHKTVMDERRRPRLIIRSIDLLRELLVFANMSDGGVGAKKGSHDDLVIALGLSIKALEQAGEFVLIPESSESPFSALVYETDNDQSFWEV